MIENTPYPRAAGSADANPYAMAYRINPDSALPFATLFHTSSLPKVEIARRLGFTKVHKGLRQLDALMVGDVRRADELKPGLALALGIDEDAVQVAIDDTRYLLWVREDRRYRASFRPHAHWRGDWKRPSPLFVFAMVVRPFYFDEDDSEQAMLAKAITNRPGSLPLVGETTGFYLNYSPDRCVVYDVNGQALESFGHAYRRGFHFALK